MSTVLVLMQISALAYALIGGVFLGFSDFIMRSLGNSSGGAEAMQTINREVFRSVFMVLFLGLVGVSLTLVGYGAMDLAAPGSVLVLCAGLIYLFGCFGITALFNVPMNTALARMEASSGPTNAYWQDTYVPRWTFWNTVRAVACAISAALLLSGMVLVAEGGGA